MGEIKSTLDLVMERTRHLSMSDEEKADQRRADFEKRLQGLLQQYADGALSVDALRDRIASLQAELAVTDRHGLAAAVVRRIDPDADPRRWLDLLDALEPAVHGPLADALSDYAHRRAERRQAAVARRREQLAVAYGIRGEAVVPNPQKDRACRSDLAALRSRMVERLEAIIDRDLRSVQT